MLEPGEAFFSSLDICDRGVFEKNMGLHEGKDYFDYEKVYNLTKEDIKELVKVKENIIIDSSIDTRRPSDKHLISLNGTDENGNYRTYAFEVCGDGSIYCNGYKTTGTGIEQWIQYLIEKYK